MIKVLLVDDHELVRTGLEQLLRKSGDIEIVGTACSGESALALAEKCKPDVILMDINMPGMGGLEASKKISLKFPEIRIIALTVHCDGPFPQQTLKAGAHGYISKSSTAEELIAGIKAVWDGKTYLSTDVAQHIALSSLSQERTPFEQLSRRELQVVMLTLQGQETSQIAEKLHLSGKTVCTYRYRIYEKLGVRNDVELTRLALKYRMLDDTQ